MTYGYIYGLRCKVNGKWYIGLTTQEPLFYIKDSYKYHKGGKRTKFARALKKYGYENFDICLLDSAENKEGLDLLEEKYIIDYKSVTNGYNLKYGGSYGSHSESTRQKISKSNKGNKSRLGMPQSKETKKKIGNANRGEKSGLFGKIGKFTGKKHTDESKKKMSVESTGRIHSVETKEKLSKMSVDVWSNLSDEKRKTWSKNLSESKKGSKNPMYRRKIEKQFHIQQVMELFSILMIQ